MSKDLPKKGSNLLILREEKGFTQEDMAQFLGVSVKAYCNYEHGSQLPKSDLLPGWCEKLKVSADFILGLSDFRTPEANYIGKETGLNDKAIKKMNALKYTDKIQPVTSIHRMPIINDMIVSDHFSELIDGFNMLLHPDYKIPAYHTGKAKVVNGMLCAGVKVPSNAMDYSKDANVYMLPFLKDKKDIMDIHTLVFDRPFMEAVAKNEIMDALAKIKDDIKGSDNKK